MKLLLLDNYDSFSYNLAYVLRKQCTQLDIIRNDKILPEQCTSYDGIILSPGPGIPINAGNLMGIIDQCAGTVPLLGICLGHQAIAEHLGCSLHNLEEVYHGIQSNITISAPESELFINVPSSFLAGRYHSWTVENSSVSDLEITARSEDGCIMAFEESKKKLYGLQFHPESILTPEGDAMIHNFINICKSLKQ